MRCAIRSGAVARLLLGERQELPRKLAHHFAVERYVVRQPDTVEDREQQQRVLRSPSSASACSISSRARSAAALVSGAACPLTWRSGAMRRPEAWIRSRRSAGVRAGPRSGRGLW